MCSAALAHLSDAADLDRQTYTPDVGEGAIVKRMMIMMKIHDSDDAAGSESDDSNLTN